MKHPIRTIGRSVSLAFSLWIVPFENFVRGQLPERPIIGRTYQESKPVWELPTQAPPGAPNVIYLLLDDVGFAHLGCYGSAIETPNMDKLASGGLRYTNFHTTAICAPSRSCLLTGYNHHANHFGTNYPTGYPGYDNVLPKNHGAVPAILRNAGYSAFHIGKWHQVPVSESSNAGPFERWPLGVGFERFYGIIGGETNQWFPHLASDNHHIETPTRPGYHLTEDLTDQAIRFIIDQQQVRPDRPFFLSLAYTAAHAPLHVHPRYIDRYRGKFDSGWDTARDETLARQKKMGIVPANTQLSPRTTGIKAWVELSDDERKLALRLQEIFAGFLTHCDENIGRLIAHLEERNLLDNTLFILTSDNGASQEGRFTGSFNEQLYFNQIPEDMAMNMKMFDKLGGPETYPHYPQGWSMVGNTPFKRWKQNTHAGGNTDPLIIHWPKKIQAKGELRSQYHHLIDVTPTVLDVVGIDQPKTLAGVDQEPFHGTSMAYSFNDAKAASRRETQYFEQLGHRAIYHRGWKAVAYHASKTDFEKDPWELYHVDEDFSESRDLAKEQPEKLAEMLQRWFAEAGKYQVLPLDDRGRERSFDMPEVFRVKSTITYFPGGPPVPIFNLPTIRDRSHRITAKVEIPAQGSEGVLLSLGGRFSGLSLYVQQNKLYYTYNYCGLERTTIVSSVDVPSGKSSLQMEFKRTGTGTGNVTLLINGQAVGQGSIPHTVPVTFGISEGLCVGRDPSTPVIENYASPFVFTGTIAHVTIELLEEAL